MNLHFTEATALAIIDRQLEELDRISPARYEIIRQVIYYTADLEYKSLLEFSESALAKGAAALTATIPIVVDVPDIQVNIVPKLQQTFGNPVYCCATRGTATAKQTKAANGLEILAREHPESIFIIGQDATAMLALLKLIQSKAVDPSLVILTPPSFSKPNLKKSLIDSTVPYIGIDSSKGGTNVASAIFNGLLSMTWRVERQDRLYK